MPDKFILHSEYQPTGDQPAAIDKLVKGVEAGMKNQVLLGVTGSGKTFTMANVIARLNRPTLVLAHNKTLAAQLCSEFREFFPENAVEYFVSYYDYYQPEAYIPGKDLYIEKDSAINDDIDKLRHSATSSLLERRDVIVVASVSCIYTLGDPEEYKSQMIGLRPGMEMDRDHFLDLLVSIRYERNDIEFTRNKFRVRGDTVEVFPSGFDNRAYRVEFFGEEIDRIVEFQPLTGEFFRTMSYVPIFPATHYVSAPEQREKALVEIKKEMEERVEYFKSQGLLIEAQRIEQRTNYDMEMLREIGFCPGIENYSRVLSGRAPGSTPYTLLDFFPDDFLLFVDESHVTIPQVGGMSGGDTARKKNLVEFGFRLPSAYDNRPLYFHEFEKKLNQTVFVSATPAKYEKEKAEQVAEQLIRPTGLVDPEIEVRPIKGQVDDLMGEIRTRAAKGQRVLVTTLTTKMAEDLTEYLEKNLLKVKYIHHEVETMERTEIIRDLRLGVFDALIGVNLLREGLDIPEVSLVAILDADKSGFLRTETSLIQTVGRAARNAEGHVIMYGDVITPAMEAAITETARRRKIQMAYNEEHGIVPKTVEKSVRDLIDLGGKTEGAKSGKKKGKKEQERMVVLSDEERLKLIDQLTAEMKTAASLLEFEKAAELRDRIESLKT